MKAFNAVIKQLTLLCTFGFAYLLVRNVGELCLGPLAVHHHWDCVDLTFGPQALHHMTLTLAPSVETWAARQDLFVL